MVKHTQTICLLALSFEILGQSLTTSVIYPQQGLSFWEFLILPPIFGESLQYSLYTIH